MQHDWIEEQRLREKELGRGNFGIGRRKEEERRRRGEKLAEYSLPLPFHFITIYHHNH